MSTARLKDVADRLLDQYDDRRNVQLVSVASSLNANMEAGTNGSPITMTGVVVTSIDKKLVDGNIILATDVMLICRAEYTPAQQDQIVLDGDNYQIVAVMPENPSGLNLLNRVVIRK